MRDKTAERIEDLSEFIYTMIETISSDTGKSFEEILEDTMLSLRRRIELSQSVRESIELVDL